uniref:Hspb associated protein 1 n=1 Tax=Poecilia formosa TaxID=48698 RepID=A0A096LPU6_POEFO
MAAVTPIKPFSPEETRWILDHLQHPAVFLNMTQGWPVLHWTAQHLSGCLQDRLIRFRLGRKEATNAPLFETQCSYIEANVAQFLRWTQHQTDVGSFSEYPCSEYWAYADYKYITTLFHDQPSMFEDVKWSEFGFEGRTGKESTLWIGTQGANTPCHLDTYGCNLVLQVQGRKRWHLFPPEDTAKLYPTRIPYEESSVFSQVHVLRPDPRKFPQFQGARAHTVTLEPGQVLYVPRHWWHYVESIDPITVSVNSWIELEVDDAARVSEAVTRTVVCALKSVPSDDNADAWLNPTERNVVMLLLLVVVLLLLLPRVSGVHFAQLFGVDVRVEVGHEGEDDADAQQEAAEQQELFPLRKCHTKSGLFFGVFLKRYLLQSSPLGHNQNYHVSERDREQPAGLQHRLHAVRSLEDKTAYRKPMAE